MTRPNSIAMQDVSSHLHPYTNARKLERDGPRIIERGEGIRVFDDAGNAYIEALAGLWSVAVGFSQPRLVEAAARQMAKLPYYHVFSQKTHAPAARLADKLASMTPDGLNHIFFTNSGSEANDTVVKMIWFLNNARGRPQKKKFIARRQAYHGITIASGSLTGLPWNHRDFDLPAIPVRHVSCPHFYLSGKEGETEAAFVARLGDELESTIAEEGAETIAAFIGEPVMGAGGVIVPPEGYWDIVQEICRRHDILIVADEVITGFGRTGKTFGCETYRIRPDMLVMSKQLTSSYMPLAAIAISDDIYETIADHTDTLGNFGHGFTGSGHPVATAVALENLAIIEEEGLVGNADRMGAVLSSELGKLASHPLVGEVRGVGLIAAVQMVANKERHQPFDPAGRVGAFVFERAHHHGLIVRCIVDAVALCPPLIVTKPDIREIADKLHSTLNDALEFARSEGLMR